MGNEWKDPGKDLPGWADSGTAQFLTKSGDVINGTIDIDAWFNGEEELPFPECKDIDGKVIDLFDMAGWRMVERVL